MVENSYPHMFQTIAKLVAIIGYNVNKQIKLPEKKAIETRSGLQRAIDMMNSWSTPIKIEDKKD